MTSNPCRMNTTTMHNGLIFRPGHDEGRKLVGVISYTQFRALTAKLHSVENKFPSEMKLQTL